MLKLIFSVAHKYQTIEDVHRANRTPHRVHVTSGSRLRPWPSYTDHHTHDEPLHSCGYQN